MSVYAIDSAKPLGEWTLQEVKEICAKRERCGGCLFENPESYERRSCFLASRPDRFILNKEVKKFECI